MSRKQRTWKTKILFNTKWKEKKKEINQSKIGGKQKKNKKEKNTESFFGPDNVWTMCGIVKSKRKKIVMVAWLKPEGFMKQSPS